jgi:4-carboxymuconolactone decarboxylase
MKSVFPLQCCLFSGPFSGKHFVALLLVVATGVATGYGLSRLSQVESNRSGGTSAAAAQAPLPKDVYPDSRSRLPLVKREELDERGKKVYDEAVNDSRSLAGLQGPAGIRLHNPRLAEAQGPLSEYVRFKNGLGPRLTQLAFLVVAREIDSQFEWTAHEPAALRAGISQELIDIVKYRRPLAGVGEKEAAIIQLGREALGQRKVTPETFALALKVFGKETLINLTAFLGYQAQTAVLLTVFDQQIPAGQKPLLPIP